MDPSSRPIIAVLGSTVQDGDASPALRSRVDAAAAQWFIANRYGLEPYVFCLGGVGSRGAELEAPVMAALLVTQGIPRSVIVEEAHSRTTEENLRHLRAIVSAQGFPEEWAGRAFADTPDPRALMRPPAPPVRIPVTIVTSTFHLPRTLLMARHLGFEPRGIGAPDAAAGRTKAILREMGALILWGARSLRRSRADWGGAS